ncbi:MAG TPA: SEC-C metal-binding domain-containing protein [Chitinispirillaceae bacterium]|nr:SEC-C metal-binding domain-containing protein [Chitinispirillaceae bacterium]
MFTSPADYIQDYLSSEHFYFLNPALKEHAESLLHFWCDQAGGDPDHNRIEDALKQIAQLNIDLEIKKAVPELVKEFYTFLNSSGKIPGAQEWAVLVTAHEDEYCKKFRDDGSVRGSTHVKKYTDTGRNDPCPCGSGKKFKKCCMGLIE